MPAKKVVGEVSEKNGEVLSIRVFEVSGQLADSLDQDFDIYFLDINMPLFNGIEISRMIKERDPEAYIVFVASTLDYAVAGYELGISAFLHKPIDYEQIENVMDKALCLIRQRDEAFVLVKKYDDMKKIYLREIVYIETTARKTMIYNANKETLETRISLKKIEEELAEKPFVRCHNCCIVNMDYIREIQSKDIVLEGEISIPLSKYKKKEVLMQYARYIGGDRVW